jgi:trehalose 2-sulfotransferase
MVEMEPRSYIICTTPRSGSTLLCDLLRETTVAGNPQSYFRPEGIHDWADHFGIVTDNWPGELSFDRPFLDAVRAYGSGQSEIFGMRLMWENFAALIVRLRQLLPEIHGHAELLHAAFQAPMCIHLSRRDKVAQAVSLLRAEQTGLWHLNADGTERQRVGDGATPSYDDGRLSILVSQLEANDEAWADWFDRNGIAPFKVDYENLSSDPNSVVSGILSSLGLDAAKADVVTPSTGRLADEQNLDWAARYRAKRQDER